MSFRRKKIFLNTKNTRYCIVKLYSNKREMQDAYKKYKPMDSGHYKVDGVSCHYELLLVTKGERSKISPETGTIFLSLDNCGAGVISHEFMHAVLWAYKHKKNKKQYPIVINNMKEEEVILHNHTYAIIQFYQWYWRIEKNINKHQQ